MTPTTTEKYVELFENAIEQQISLVGPERAFEQAKKAGLTVSTDGHIVSCAGSPIIVLLRLVKYFTGDGNLAALEHCTPLINQLLEINHEFESDDETA